MRFDPIKEYDKIAKWTASLIGKQMLVKNFSGQLSRYLNKNNHPIKVRVIKDSSLDPDDFTFGAEYDSELDELGKKPIRINFIINHSRFTAWKITEQISHDLALSLIETLAHEYQHLKQYRARGYKTLNHKFDCKETDYKKKEEKLYLSNPDEIDAYSTNIAVRQYIEETRFNITKHKRHLDLATYYKAFGKTHPVVKDLEQQINDKLTTIREKKNGKNKRSIRKSRMGA